MPKTLPAKIYAREFGELGLVRRVWRPPTDQPWSNETVFVQQTVTENLARVGKRIDEWTMRQTAGVPPWLDDLRDALAAYEEATNAPV